MGLGLSKTVILREAQRTIEAVQQAATIPRVLWARISESAESLALRCAALQNLGAHKILVAVPHGLEVPETVQAVEFPAKLFNVLHPSHRVRYRVAAGGRGSAKSHAFAAAVVLRMISQRERVLCCREIMRSIRESQHHLLKTKIEQFGLPEFFDISDRAIACIPTGSEVIFSGLFAHIDSLRSLEQVTIAWVEQAEGVSAESLAALVPTVREHGSSIWLTLNPDSKDAPAQAFVDSDRSDVLATHVDWRDNPWWPPELELERVYLARVDPDAHAWVYGGQCRMHSQACVFAGKYVIEEFVPDLSLGKESAWKKDRFASLGRDEELNALLRKERATTWQGPYLGLDWGFSIDPLAAVVCWILGRRLYIEHEAWAIGCELDHTADLLDRMMPSARKYVIRADSARPEAISFLKNHGYPRMTAAKKGKGSVEDGVAFLKAFEQIYVHPRCTHMAEELRLFSYKVDKLSGDVMPELAPGHDHLIDALRYALEPAIKQRRPGIITRLKF